ncbi:hypothetical protein L484_012801 [Morus notabilis]|uniref:Mitochondrial import inner membrane translocase subunit TIM50 n=1 Tax=Morus notabilis TaxID=981085 RepID=W9SB01_9ROSA|nr:uncharacterized protein LOC21395995 [Morus notabilis]EXC33911.1 hypothetical protein L484_012801 [Morus notabilis]
MSRETISLKGKLKCENNSDEEKDSISLKDLGFSLEKLNLGPKKKLLVLGFGGFLCHRVFRYDQPKIPTFRRPDAAYGNNLVYIRPHCKEFIKFCLERFEIGIWSSAKEYNLDSTLECIMKGLKSKLLFAWGQEKCTDTGFGSLEKKDKPLFLKELKKIWQNNNAALPRCKGQFSQLNTLLIDDKPYKALLNPVHNGIFPSQYNIDDTKDDAFGPKGELRMYLAKLVAAKDVPSFVKEHPFGQPPITPSHSQWKYYSKVVRKFQKTTA